MARPLPLIATIVLTTILPIRYLLLSNDMAYLLWSMDDGLDYTLYLPTGRQALPAERY